MRAPPLIGSPDDEVEYQSVKPHPSPCPQCGKRGKRKHGITRRIAHVAALHRRSWSVADVGVYQARWACGKYGQAALPGVPPRGRYFWEGRHTVAHALMRARMPSLSVMRRRQEESRLALSLGYIHACCLWAQEQINMEPPGEGVRTNFSGGLCLDEVHARGRPILFAPEPLADFTGSFKLVEPNDHDHMAAFLHALNARGLDAQGIITDGAPLYKDALQRYWSEVAPPLWVFHLLKDVPQLIRDGGRALKNHRKRQGNKGRTQRRGRPSKKAQQHRQRRRGMRKKAQARCIGEPQSLIGRPEDDLSEQDRDALALLCEIAPALKRFRQVNQPLYRLFEKGITKQCARSRRPRLVNQAPYQANAFVAKALTKLSTDTFDQRLVWRGGETGQRPHHHGERHRRVFRRRQKTRSKRRKPHTMAKALALERYARMVEHPVYRHNLRE